MFEISLYTDGASSGNPGPAGIGIVLICGDRRKEITLAIGEATNNVAELRAAIEGLKALHHPERSQVTLYTDSQYVEGILNGWKARANLELITELRALTSKCAAFKVAKIKGHSGDKENERADYLARAVIERPRSRAKQGLMEFLDACRRGDLAVEDLPFELRTALVTLVNVNE